MLPGKKAIIGCIILPLLLIGSCVGKINLDRAMYVLPGEVLTSCESPTVVPDSALTVAGMIDSYVQPRFEILRDKTFGQFRIIYRKHAGIVQLKVDTAEEKQQIANVNATGRDYAIGLLHCAPVPGSSSLSARKALQILYINQHAMTADFGYPPQNYFAAHDRDAPEIENIRKTLQTDTVEQEALAVLPALMKGQEYRTTIGQWAVLMRPVLAAKASCLSCHTSQEQNATLGVMVYMVGPVRKASSLQVSR
jgi:hypothetical protein